MDTHKLMLYRLLGVVVVAGATGLGIVYGAQYPALVPLVSAVCWYVGKLLGIPTDAVVQTALQAMHPDKAVNVAVSALRSLPPAQAVAATQQLLTSIPPQARQAAVEGAVVQLVNTGSTEPPPAA